MFVKCHHVVGTSLHQFCENYPAFCYGLFAYLGAIFALGGHFVVFIPIFVFLVFGLSLSLQHFQKQFLLSLCIAIASYMYVTSHVILPPKHLSQIPGTAHLEIDDIGSDSRYGRTYYRMTASIKRFQPDCGGFIVTNLPCRLIWNQKSFRPHGGKRYKIKGELRQKPDGFSFKPDLNGTWMVEGESFSLVEPRLHLKGQVKCFLAKYMKAGHVRLFLEGVLIGEFHENHLKGALKRFGLQHILVVSGFHFSLVLAIFYGIFRIFLSLRLSQYALVLVASAFFLFIGPTPSVFRAYVAALAILTAFISERTNSGINAIGLGLIFVVLYDPTTTFTPSFQLSFLATWAILVLLPICRKMLFANIATHRFSEISRFSLFEQLTFTLSSFFLSASSLVIAVTLMMLPVSLFYFQSFPLLGLIYNCFFPFFVSISITLVILAGLFFWLQPLCGALLSLAAYYTDLLLTLVQSAPANLDVTLYCEGFSIWLLVSYLCTVSLTAITINSEK